MKLSASQFDVILQSCFISLLPGHGHKGSSALMAATLSPSHDLGFLPSLNWFIGCCFDEMTACRQLLLFNVLHNATCFNDRKMP